MTLGGNVPFVSAHANSNLSATPFTLNHLLEQ
jgi:hypothetical protein